MSVHNSPNPGVPILPSGFIASIKQEIDTIDFEENQLNTDDIKQELFNGIIEEDPDDDLDILNNQKYPFLASILRPKKTPLKHHEAQLEECFICGKTVKYLEKHLGTHEGVQPEECVVCGKKVKHLAKHMEVHEDAMPTVKCTICSKKVKYLERHMEMHEDKRFACTYCPKVFTRKCYIQNHIRDKHKGMPLEIMEVDQSFVDQRQQEELNDPLRIAKCTCPYCGSVCKTSKGLTNHMWMKHRKFTSLSEKKNPLVKTEKSIKQEDTGEFDEANFKCSFCGILCKLSQSLKTHLMTKHNKTPEENIEHADKLANGSKTDPDEVHQCNECGIICKTAKTLSNHFQYKHKNEKFICDHCGKIFACKPYLKLHIRLMHQPVTLIKCTKCDELFKRKSSLSRHMKTHLPKSLRKDKQFPCEHCTESYTTKRDLLEHIKIAHKALNCFMCDEVFFNKLEFGKHVITHSDYSKQVELRPFACDICGKRFQIESYCKSHKVLQHTSDGNANKCVDCGKEFLNAILLKKHRRNHARKYKCHFCDVTCLRKAKLDKHIAIHMVDTPFKCKFCNSSFQARVALNSHLRWHKAQNAKATAPVKVETNDSSEADDPIEQGESSNSVSNRDLIPHEIFSGLSNSNSSSSVPGSNFETVENVATSSTIVIPPLPPIKTEDAYADLPDLLVPKIILKQENEVEHINIPLFGNEKNIDASSGDSRSFCLSLSNMNASTSDNKSFSLPSSDMDTSARDSKNFCLPFNVPIKKEPTSFDNSFSHTLMSHEIVNNMEQSAFCNYLNLQSIPLEQVGKDVPNGEAIGPSGSDYVSL